MKNKIMSLQDWNKKGFRVRKGSKAVKRSQGQSLFSSEQVYKPNDPYPEDGHNRDKYYDLADAYFNDWDWC